MANFDIRQNSNIRYRRIATILPEYQLFHQNTQFPTRIHNSLPEYQNKLPEYQDKINSFTILRITVFCILPLILQSDPSYQMLTWSLSLKHWLLQQYVSKAHSILFHTVVPVLFPMVYNALLTETYALPSPLSSEASMSKASWKFMITPTFTIFLLLVVHLQESFKLLNSSNSNRFCIHLFSSHQ